MINLVEQYKQEWHDKGRELELLSNKNPATIKTLFELDYLLDKKKKLKVETEKLYQRYRTALDIQENNKKLEEFK